MAVELANEPTPLLLKLPIQLRNAIYSYILPRTIEGDHRSREHVWLPGETALLCVSREISKSAIDYINSTSTFDIDVSSGMIRFTPIVRVRGQTRPFLFRSITPGSLCEIGSTSISQIRNFHLFVLYPGYLQRYPDKTHRRGRDRQAAQTKTQLISFINLINSTRSLDTLRVRITDYYYGDIALIHRKSTYRVLEPLRQLRGVGRVDFVGPVGSSWSKKLAQDMMSAEC